ncbi:hypothetical protein C8J57DRAFT_1733253, partial [Mycena rebaudengoi]
MPLTVHPHTAPPNDTFASSLIRSSIRASREEYCWPRHPILAPKPCAFIGEAPPCTRVPQPFSLIRDAAKTTPQLTADIAPMASIIFFAATIGHGAPNTRRGLAQRRPNTPPDDAEVIAAPAAVGRVAERVRTDPAEIAVVEIDKDGGVHIPGDAGVVYGLWAGTLGQFSSDVPPTLFLPAHHFQLPRPGALSCALDQTQSDDTLNLARSAPYALRPTFLSTRAGARSCPP